MEMLSITCNFIFELRKELTLVMLCLLSSKAQGPKIFENHLKAFVLVFIG